VTPRAFAAARKYGLGEPELRVRHRPGALGTALFLILIIVSLEFWESDSSAPISVSFMILTPTVAVLWLFTTVAKLRGGLYVFAGGIADVYGDHIHTALRWPEIAAVGQLTTLYVLNFIPVGWQRECTITARNGKTLRLTGAYKDLNSVVALIRQRIR
jgi:uncharacterized protein DUF6585